MCFSYTTDTLVAAPHPNFLLCFQNKEQEVIVDQLTCAERHNSMVNHDEAFFCPKYNTMIAQGLLPDTPTLFSFAKVAITSLRGAFSDVIAKSRSKKSLLVGLTITLVTPQLFGPWAHATKSRLLAAQVVISLKDAPMFCCIPILSIIVFPAQ